MSYQGRGGSCRGLWHLVTCPCAVHPILETSSLHSGKSSYHPPGSTMVSKRVPSRSTPWFWGCGHQPVCEGRKSLCQLVLPDGLLPRLWKAPTDPVQGAPRAGAELRKLITCSSPGAPTPQATESGQRQSATSLWTLGRKLGL